jgi:DNA (cytosine-5)-methyltransferase 1
MEPMQKLRGLDLFSGIGGISLALSPWVETVAYCEIEPYCQAVLLERMQSNDLDSAPIWDDVTTLNREILDTPIDIIFGGFPCTDISVAGKQLGIKSDTRSGLFFHIMRLVREFNPKYIFLENVAAICSNGLDTVLRKIAEAGYDAQWCCLSAAEVGAPHKRDRWWLLAYSKAWRLETGWARSDKAENGKIFHGKFECPGENVANSKCERLEGHSHAGKQEVPQSWDLCNHRFPAIPGQTQFEWEPPRIVANANRKQMGRVAESRQECGVGTTESRMGGTPHGLPNRVDRIKALGNSVVPQAAREAFRRLMYGTESRESCGVFASQNPRSPGGPS